MKIVDLIKRDMVVPALRRPTSAASSRSSPRTWRGTIRASIARTLSKVLIEREQLASTAIGEGVAIPHGKLGAVGEIVACLGRAPTGVEFDSMDGQPTYLFFVLVAPESSTGAHLKALARISRVFKDPEFRRRLLAAPRRRIDVPRGRGRGRQVLNDERRDHGR